MSSKGKVITFFVSKIFKKENERVIFALLVPNRVTLDTYVAIFNTFNDLSGKVLFQMKQRT